MTTQHTPGPWTIDPDLDRFYFQIKDYKGNKVASSRAGTSKSTDEEGDRLCLNARLIAAAPDYHDGALAFIAYEDAMSSGDDISAMIHYNNASKLLRAANAKATGATE